MQPLNAEDPRLKWNDTRWLPNFSILQGPPLFNMPGIVQEKGTTEIGKACANTTTHIPNPATARMCNAARMEAHGPNNQILQSIIAEYNSWNPAVAASMAFHVPVQPLVHLNSHEEQRVQGNVRQHRGTFAANWLSYKRKLGAAATANESNAFGSQRFEVGENVVVENAKRVAMDYRPNLTNILNETERDPTRLGGVSGLIYPNPCVTAVQNKCRHPSGCMRSSKGKSKGMCAVHGGFPKCTHPSGCQKQIISSRLPLNFNKNQQLTGFCADHGRSAHFNKLYISSGPRNGGKRRRCTHPSGCDKMIVSKRLCIAHGAKRRRCTHESGCDKQGQSKGLCRAHGGGKRCTHTSGCKRHAREKGLCRIHGLEKRVKVAEERMIMGENDFLG